MLEQTKALCNKEIIEQFANKKYNEGVVAERERIAKKLAEDEKMCCEALDTSRCSVSNCFECWMKYLNGSTLN